MYLLYIKDIAVNIILCGMEECCLIVRKLLYVFELIFVSDCFCTVFLYVMKNEMLETVDLITIHAESTL